MLRYSFISAQINNFIHHSPAAAPAAAPASSGGIQMANYRKETQTEMQEDEGQMPPLEKQRNKNAWGWGAEKERDRQNEETQTEMQQEEEEQIPSEKQEWSHIFCILPPPNEFITLILDQIQ